MTKELLLIICAIFTGCGPLIRNEGPAPVYYVLEVKDECTPSQKPGGLKLQIPEMDAAPFLDSQRIVFAPEPVTRASYQYALWTESPSRRLSEHLVNRLRCSRDFSQVSSETSFIDPDYILSTRLLDFHHDATTNPGKAIVEVSAEIVTAIGKKSIATRVFHKEAQLSSYDAPGAVKALGLASEALLEELTQWLGDTFPR